MVLGCSINRTTSGRLPYIRPYSHVICALFGLTLSERYHNILLSQTGGVDNLAKCNLHQTRSDHLVRKQDLPKESLLFIIVPRTLMSGF